MFTCAYGVTFVVLGALDFYYNAWPKYVSDAFWFVYKWLSIQGWIFAVRYLESSVKTGETSCITEKSVNWLNWVVAASYSGIMVVLLVLGEINDKIYIAGNCGDRCNKQYYIM